LKSRDWSRKHVGDGPESARHDQITAGPSPTRLLIDHFSNSFLKVENHSTKIERLLPNFMPILRRNSISLDRGSSKAQSAQAHQQTKIKQRSQSMNTFSSPLVSRGASHN
jgi:hypothetical protein